MPLVNSQSSFPKLRPYKETFAGFFTMGEVAQTAVFLNGCVGAWAFLDRWLYRCGNLIGAVLSGFRKTHGVVGVEFTPEILGFLEQ